ncbi:hypothetical protein AB0N09_05210 [Streptomyces erythrochromogenes]|uniref:hypothetical protein n=1 Tax=Streptomyces erythrochromogenes TaxID=285574 RepID=UPI00343E971F
MTTHVQRPAAVTARIDTPQEGDAPHAEPETVWVLRRWDRHDDVVTLYTTEDSALAGLAGYVDQYWSNIAHRDDVPEQPPSDPREAVQLYYGQDRDSRPDEGYTLYQDTVTGPNTHLAADVAHTLFEDVRRAAWRVASDHPDDYDLMCRADDMDPRNALEEFKNASLPSDLIEPIAAALALLAPDVYAPRSA